MAKGERLTCYVTQEAKDEIDRVGRSIEKKRGRLSKAYRVLMRLAFENPDADIRNFPGDEDQTCSLDATAQEVAQLDDYQDHHELGERRRGFKKALLQGLSVHLERERR